MCNKLIESAGCFAGLNRENTSYTILLPSAKWCATVAGMRRFAAVALIFAAGAVIWRMEFGGSASIPYFWIGKFTSVPAWDAETERKVVMDVTETGVDVDEWRIGEQRRRLTFKVVKCRADSDSMLAETADGNHVRMDLLGPGVFKVRWSEFVDYGEEHGVIVSR